MPERQPDAAAGRSAAPRRLDFDWRCVVGAVDTDPADYASESPLLGLPMSQTFLYGSVRDRDGTIWTPMRRFAAGDGGTERLLLQTDLGSDALHVYRTGPRPAPSGGVRRALDGDAVVFESDPAAPGPPFRIRANGQKFRWVEEGVLDLEGVAVPPGLHWHLPDRRNGMYYLSQIFEVEGTVLGREVRGFIPMDQLWMDGMIYVDDIFIGERAEVAWFTWATRYADGSFDGGHFLLGHRQLGFALVYDETGRVTGTTQVDGRVILDGDDLWPERIELTAGGDDWEFLPASTGRMVDLMPIPNPADRGPLAPRRRHPRAGPLVRVGRSGPGSRHHPDPGSPRPRLNHTAAQRTATERKIRDGFLLLSPRPAWRWQRWWIARHTRGYRTIHHVRPAVASCCYRALVPTGYWPGGPPGQ